MKKTKVSYKITIFIMVMQIVIFAALYAFVSHTITQNIRENTINSMKTIVEERSQIIENYVRETESYLTAYGRAGEISALLQNPSDEKAVADAQKYTERYSGDIENLEGIYVSEWDTHVLAHTNPAVVGITTREGASLEALQESMLAADGVYNVGFIFSPASGKQIVSMYRACLDEKGEPVGLIGAGIYISGLKETLDSLPTAGLSNAGYCLINTQTGEYIFHEDEEKPGSVATEKFVTDILEKINKNGQTGPVTEYLEYTQDKVSSIAVYHYIADRDWLFVLTDTTKEIFASSASAAKQLLVICALMLVLLISITYFIISMFMRPLSPITKMLRRIADCDISNTEGVKKYTGRRDDIGEMANASDSVIRSLNSIVSTLKTCSANLNKKAVSLRGASANLVDCTNDNISTTQEFSASQAEVNDTIEEINEEIGSMNHSINEVAVSLQNSAKASNRMMDSAGQMKASAHTALQNTKKRLEETRASAKEALESLNNLSQINEMAAGILEIANQTNLLSINASIEAARSGEMGRGFAVVAEEIGKLAETSKETAAHIRELCESSNDSIRVVNGCVGEIIQYMETDILDNFDDFAEKSNHYSESAEKIEQDIRKLGIFTDGLKTSMAQIYESVMNVKEISEQNSAAIEDIVRKSESTAGTAGEILEYAEENTQMADTLLEIVDEFTLT